MASPRTIQGDVNGTGTVTYELPSGVFQYVQAIRVTVDNTAGADAIATLDIAEQAGVVIATKEQGRPIPAGGTGSATWFLRGADEQHTSSSVLPWCSAQVNPAPIAPGVTPANYFNLQTNDGAAFSLNGSGFLVFGRPGIYSVNWGFFASSTLLGGPVANPWTLFVQGGSSTNVGTLLADMGGPSTSGVVLSPAIQTWQNTFGRVVSVSSPQVGGHFTWNWNNSTAQTLAVRGGVLVVALA